MTSISYQLYCSRNFPPLEDTLGMLSRLGFREVEGYGGLYDDVERLKLMLDQNGLKMPTAHFGLSMLEDTPDKALEIARHLEIETVIVPFLMPDDRPTDASGWRTFGERLAAAGLPLVDEGFGFGWHNHAFEFDRIEGDDLPLDLILSGGDHVGLELDLGWARVAGHDPLKCIETYGDRLIAAHVKDIAPDGENTDEDGWADVGHGIMDWAPIHAALQGKGVSRYVLEHDNPADHERFARRSLASVQNF